MEMRGNRLLSSRRFKIIFILFIGMAFLYIATQFIWLKRLHYETEKSAKNKDDNNIYVLVTRRQLVIDVIGEGDKYSADKNMRYQTGVIRMAAKYDKYGRIYTLSPPEPSQPHSISPPEPSQPHSISSHEPQFITSMSVVGIRQIDAERYKPDENNMFHCLSSTSNQRIPYEQVNDDYCDCSDSSDEPGTSACLDGRFYCSSQDKYIPSSKVNDGICDCCDGNDEYLNKPFPKHFHPDDSIKHTPCTNHCMELTQSRSREMEMISLAREKKNIYLKYGAKYADSQEFGVGGVFHMLSTACFNHTRSEYKYVVCPFQQVTQTNLISSHTVILGRAPHSWLVEGHALLLSGGDSDRCPGQYPRKTTVYFSCGLDDHVKEVSEPEVCKYNVMMMSPAAC